MQRNRFLTRVMTLAATFCAVASSGEHIPVSYVGHGYANQTCVPRLRRFMLIFTHSSWRTRAIPQRWTWLDSQYQEVRTGNHGHVTIAVCQPKRAVWMTGR